MFSQHEQHDVGLRFVKDPVQTRIHKLPPKSSVERAVFICKKGTKNFSVKSHLSEKIEKGNQPERPISRKMMIQVCMVLF